MVVTVLEIVVVRGVKVLVRYKVLLRKHLILVHFVDFNIIIQVLYVLLVELFRIDFRDFTSITNDSKGEIQVLALHAYPIPCTFFEYFLLLICLFAKIVVVIVAVIYVVLALV